MFLQEKWAKNLYIASICYGRTVSWIARVPLQCNLCYYDLSILSLMLLHHGREMGKASICYGQTVSWISRVLLQRDLRFYDLSILWLMLLHHSRKNGQSIYLSWSNCFMNCQSSAATLLMLLWPLNSMSDNELLNLLLLGNQEFSEGKFTGHGILEMMYAKNSPLLPSSHCFSYKHPCTVFKLCQNAMRLI